MTEQASDGHVRTSVEQGIASVEFGHPKGNSLPAHLLSGLAEQIDKLGRDTAVKVVVLRSAGDRTFCGGASFDELLAVEDLEGGKRFFSGFARVILAMRSCPKFVVARVQGKAVGGGVGLVSAADYALATRAAAVKLSELALGIGPFVVGPAVERRLGLGPFRALATDADWRDAEWAHRHGLYAGLVDSVEQLDSQLADLVQRLAGFSAEAMKELKSAFWQGTDDWDILLKKRAEISGRLVLTDHARRTIHGAKGAQGAKGRG